MNLTSWIDCWHHGILMAMWYNVRLPCQHRITIKSIQRFLKPFCEKIVVWYTCTFSIHTLHITMSCQFSLAQYPFISYLINLVKVWHHIIMEPKSMKYHLVLLHITFQVTTREVISKQTSFVLQSTIQCACFIIVS